jgi:hypothetical protein
MSGEQLALWVDAYQAVGGVIPDIGAVRAVYRKLLFTMTVLGVDDLTQWLRRAHYFA